MINLSDYREKRKYIRIIDDLEHILTVINKSQEAFMFFKHYTMCQELISALETNKTLVHIYQKQYAQKLKEVENET